MAISQLESIYGGDKENLCAWMYVYVIIIIRSQIESKTKSEIYHRYIPLFSVQTLFLVLYTKHSEMTERH